MGAQARPGPRRPPPGLGWRAAGWLALGLALAAGCSGPPRSDVAGGETVRGKVTYKGEPVPYGLVLFYNERSLNVESGLFMPVAVAQLDSGGNYEMLGAPLGPIQVSVATDPDQDLVALARPTLPGETGSVTGAGEGPAGGPSLPTARPLPGRHLPPGANDQSAATFLSASQKRRLREVHAKYGAFGKCDLSYVVRPGDQTFNIPLK